jgi:RTX calcium-binding nonapeptide repeat (4 copies)
LTCERRKYTIMILDRCINTNLFHSDYRKYLPRESVGEIKALSKALEKFHISYLVVLVAIAVPIFWDGMILWMPFIIVQGQEGSSSLQEPSTGGGGLSINRTLDRSANEPISQEAVITGSFGEDRITGSNGSDIIIGLLGADTLRGGNGDDKIQGNEDLDRLYGENGSDLLQGGAATDQLYGGEGDDILAGGMGDDYLIGENGNDKLYGGVEDDILQGGLGADYFDCGDGIDIVIDFDLEQSDDNAGNCEEIS